MKAGIIRSLKGLCVRAIMIVVAACTVLSARGAAPAASPETAKRLAALEKSFQETADREAGTGYKTAVETLEKGYAGALDRAVVSAIAAGKTEEALALRNEKQRLEKGEAVPEAETGDEPGDLKTLRTTYRNSREQVEAARRKKLQPLFDKYLQALAALTTELTKAGQLEDAVVVRAAGEEVLRARTSASSVAAATFASSKKVTGLERSFTNSLGMKFVPVPGTKMLLCIHETRRRDYAVFAAANPAAGNGWKNTKKEGVEVGTGSQDDPVVMVNWDEARAFCQWLGKKEGHAYRLPTDHEWSLAAGIGGREPTTESPKSLSNKIKAYPWGAQGPPTQGSGNFQDESYDEKFKSKNPVKGYNDGFAATAPVMSFKPTSLGLYDLAGNVWEWCEDWFDEAHDHRVIRGGAFTFPAVSYSFRNQQIPTAHSTDIGFRCVLEPDK